MPATWWPGEALLPLAIKWPGKATPSARFETSAALFHFPICLICCDFGAFVDVLALVIYVTRRRRVWKDLDVFFGGLQMQSAGLRLRLLLVWHQLVMRVSLDFGSKSFFFSSGRRKKIDWRFSLFTFKAGVVSSGRKGAAPRVRSGRPGGGQVSGWG